MSDIFGFVRYISVVIRLLLFSFVGRAEKNIMISVSCFATMIA